MPWVPHASSVSSNEAKAELDAAASLDEAGAETACSCCRTPPDASRAFARSRFMLASCTRDAAAESDNMPRLNHKLEHKF